jgi:hypothetical protein
VRRVRCRDEKAAKDLLRGTENLDINPQTPFNR